MRALKRTFLALALSLLPSAAATTLGAQSTMREVSVTPASTMHPDWLNEGAESPNGRFVAFSSYAGDQAFVRYDRATRQWATVSDVVVGGWLQWSPDGRFIAHSRLRSDTRQRAIWVQPMDTATGLPRGTARRVSTSPAMWPAWSPDGRRIVYAVNDSGRFRLAIVPFNGGDEQIVYEGRGSGSNVAWAPDSRFLFATLDVPPRRPATWLRVNLATRKVDSFPAAAFRLVGYSPDGERIAHADQTNGVLVISSASTGKPIQHVKLPPRVRPTGWSRTTPNTFTAIENIVPTHFLRVSLPDGQLESITRVDSTAFGGARHSPDGRSFAYARRHGGWHRIHIASSDGSSDRVLGPSGIITHFRWAPSGKHIAVARRAIDASGAVRSYIELLDVATGAHRELARSKAGSMMGLPVGWRSDGEAVRYVSFPNGEGTSPREFREITLAGQDRLLVSAAAEASYAHFIHDTLAVLRKGTGIDGLSLRTGKVSPLYTGSIRMGNEVGISNDEAWLVFAANNGDGNMYPQLVSITSGETRKVPYSLKGELAAIFFHPDGRRLIASACITCVAPSYVEKWDVVEIPMNGDPPRVLTARQPSYKDYGFPSVSPDGRSIVFEAQQSYNTRVVTLTLPRP